MRKYSVWLRAAQIGLVGQKEIVYASSFEVKIEWSKFIDHINSLRVFSGNHRLDLEVLPTYIVLKAKTRPIFIRRRKWYHHLMW